MSDSLTVAAPPTANETAANMLATMAALSGVVTDYNPGSQVRTWAESIGAVTEMQGVAAEAQAIQALAYSAISAFGITPEGAVAAVGTVTFLTGTGGSPPLATQAVAIPAGTLVATNGGVQFQTTADAVLAINTSSISVPVQAVIGGSTGNVVSGAIDQILSSLAYPLFVSNGAPTTGGTDAETVSATLARFAAKVSSLGLCSPVNIANAVIGVQVTGTGETVQYANCYEPWVAAGTGAGSGTAGFTVYIDGGTGSATSGLVAAVVSFLNGNAASGQSGYRPAGVPYVVSGVTPVYANVAVTGVVASGASASGIVNSMTTAIQQYFQGLNFAQPAQQGPLAAAALNSVLGLLSSFTLTLAYTGGAPVLQVTGAANNRIILNTLAMSVS